MHRAATARSAGAAGRHWTTCWTSCRRRSRERIRRAGASTRACWRCATTRAARLRALVQRTGQWLRGRAGERAAAATVGALRLADWIEPLLRRESYLALLVERPDVQERLLRLLGRRAGRRAT